VADSIASYIRTSQDILQNFEAKLVKVILMCRVGRGVSDNNGVSPRGRDYYDRLIALFGDRLAPLALAAVAHVELQLKLDEKVAREQACQALKVLKTGVVAERLQECIDFLVANLPAKVNASSMRSSRRCPRGTSNGPRARGAGRVSRSAHRTWPD
jgi:hypothetical protein